MEKSSPLPGPPLTPFSSLLLWLWTRLEKGLNRNTWTSLPCSYFSLPSGLWRKSTHDGRHCEGWQRFNPQGLAGAMLRTLRAGLGCGEGGDGERRCLVR